MYVSNIFFEDVGAFTRNIVHVVTDVITNDVTDEDTYDVKRVIALCPYIDMLLSGIIFFGINQAWT